MPAVFWKEARAMNEKLTREQAQRPYVAPTE